MTKKPVILDVDTGVDDSMALMLAASSDKLEIKAITTTFGNNSVDTTTYNTLKVCELLGLNDVPVAKGATGPLIVTPKISSEKGPKVHGDDGLGDAGGMLPEPKKQACGLSAVELMAKTVRESSEPVAIVATGPISNVAAFLAGYPELHDKIDCVALMGGAAFGGNVMPTAEANAWNDPEALQIVLLSGVKVAMFGLDVTLNDYILDEEREALKKNGGRVGEFLYSAYEKYTDFYKTVGKAPGAMLHDSHPVAWLIDESLFELKHCHVEVELGGAYTRGCTVVDVNGMLRKEPNAYVALGSSRERVVNLHLEAVKKFA